MEANQCGDPFPQGIRGARRRRRVRLRRPRAQPGLKTCERSRCPTGIRFPFLFGGFHCKNCQPGKKRSLLSVAEQGSYISCPTTSSFLKKALLPLRGDINFGSMRLRPRTNVEPLLKKFGCLSISGFLVVRYGSMGHGHREHGPFINSSPACVRRVGMFG